MENRKLMLRALVGAVLGAALAPLLVCLLGRYTLPAPQAAAVGSANFAALPLPVTPAMARQYGPALALVIQSALGAVLGGVVLTATMPFADDGRELVLRSVSHFLATAAAFAALLWVCRWVDSPAFVLVWLAILLVLYVAIWLGRYVGWYMEVVELRRGLGLAPGPSPLKWRETLPYLPFLLLVCLGLPVLGRLCDPADVPVLSGLIIPFGVQPLALLCSGVSLGKRQGGCPLFALGTLLLCLPTALTLGGGTACALLCAGAAALGNALGAWVAKRRG